MKTATPVPSLCSRLGYLAIPIGVGAAVSVSNGPAVGVAIGAAIAIVLTAARR